LKPFPNKQCIFILLPFAWPSIHC